MGQHKYNPTAIAAKKGELPPKPKKMSRLELEAMVAAMIRTKTGVDEIRSFLKGNGIELY